MPNTPEKIAKCYLRLNGFFQMEKFTFFDDVSNHNHVDIFGLRCANWSETYNCNDDGEFEFKNDDDLFRRLGKIIKKTSGSEIDSSENEPIQVAKGEDVSVIAEVKGGSNQSNNTELKDNHLKKAKDFINCCPLVPVLFKKYGGCPEIKKLDDKEKLEIGLKYSLNWSKKRINEVECWSGLSKSGSWYLSDNFLMDLIYLNDLCSNQ